ncbi:MAG: pyridoxal-phosphate dependent enzyme [Mucinivorans sp.]
MSNTSPDFQADEFLLDRCVGNTPLVRLQRLASHTQAAVLAKLEGNNPAGSVKDRPALLFFGTMSLAIAPSAPKSCFWAL